MRKSLFWLVLLLSAARPGVGNCELLINEIMADPASDWDGDATYHFRDDEWIEIVNTGGDDADLTGYFLADDAGALVYGFAGMLAPGQVRVVFGSQSVDWESSHGETATGLRLSNDGDTVALWHVVGSDTTLVDAYEFNTHEADDDRSTGRNPDGGSTWEIFDSLNPYGGEGPPAGNGLPPTPGESNGGQPTPVEEATWGQVKSMFQLPGR